MNGEYQIVTNQDTMVIVMAGVSFLCEARLNRSDRSSSLGDVTHAAKKGPNGPLDDMTESMGARVKVPTTLALGPRSHGGIALGVHPEKLRPFSASFEEI